MTRTPATPSSATPATAPSGTSPPTAVPATGASAWPPPRGDFDNDGDPDLYVGNFGPNVLYRNEGAGRFRDVTTEAAVGDSGWGAHAAFADYDRDGDLDLYVANYMDFDVEANLECFGGEARAYCGPTTYPGQSGVLYRNDGDAPLRRRHRCGGPAQRTRAGSWPPSSATSTTTAMPTSSWPTTRRRTSSSSTRTTAPSSKPRPWPASPYNDEGLAESAMGADLGDYDNDGRPRHRPGHLPVAPEHPVSQRRRRLLLRRHLRRRPRGGERPPTWG